MELFAIVENQRRLACSARVTRLRSAATPSKTGKRGAGVNWLWN